MPDALPSDLAAAIRAVGVRRGRVGDPLYYFHETTSTNDVAARYAEQGAPEGTTVVASAQTAGRGRLGRSWYSPPGSGLYVSVVFRSARAAPFLTLAGGVAAAESVRAATGLPLEIKWPNDVVTRSAGGPSRRRKIAGVLAEASSTAEGVQHVVVGIGINLGLASYPAEIANRASSVESELGRPVEAGPILAELLVALQTELEPLARGEPGGLLARWRRLSPSSQGTPIECETSQGRVRGVAAGIADDGALLVRVGGNRIERVIAGEIVWK
jgi:BirA family biotin operon repressor/biotin-[acetyl-CoA-carboxylase] ligase